VYCRLLGARTRVSGARTKGAPHAPTRACLLLRRDAAPALPEQVGEHGPPGVLRDRADLYELLVRAGEAPPQHGEALKARALAVVGQRRHDDPHVRREVRDLQPNP